jgi:hypothetical protein
MFAGTPSLQLNAARAEPPAPTFCATSRACVRRRALLPDPFLIA